MAEHELKSKVIVITGASSGFGKGAALKFAEQGASLVLAARRAGLLAEHAEECLARGSRKWRCANTAASTCGSWWKIVRLPFARFST